MEPRHLLEYTLGMTLVEALERTPRNAWGKVFPVCHEGRVIGIVTLLEPEAWFRPCDGPTGLRKVVGTWQLQPKPAPGLPKGINGWSHAILDDVKQCKGGK